MTALVEDMESIVRTIWDTLFDLPLERVDSASVSGNSSVTGLVHIDGAWHGGAMVQCPLPLAATLASAMFQSDAGTEEVQDAVGELANMLTGNVKALLPEPCRLSLPMVVFGDDYELAVIGTHPVATVSFVCDGQPLLVTLVQRDGEGGEA